MVCVFCRGIERKDSVIFGAAKTSVSPEAASKRGLRQLVGENGAVVMQGQLDVQVYGQAKQRCVRICRSQDNHTKNCAQGNHEYSGSSEDSEMPVRCIHQDNSTGVLTMEEPLPRERKFIVFESSLHELLTNCSICGRAVSNLNFSVMGTLVVVEGVCEQLHKLRWRCQPLVRDSGAGAGSFLLAAGMQY
ncbi:hypothetical protein HPB51_006997 [Rhipicephalus microplus]|uniref:Uncharacterized protein n=1 Tax=Rhipicephalus microplus TaxID=6941 RepID=A0A9J6EGF2_RHIMP|nr:hypothetical protein HPB51_006997 [Rhipicephalus microplus]